MKKLSFIMLSLSFFIFLFSCNSGADSEKENSENEETKTTVSDETNETSTKVETPAETETVASTSSSSDETEPFSYLKKMKIHRDLFLKYNESKSTVYNKPLANLEKSHPLYTESKMGEELLVKTEVAPGKAYYICFDPGPSGDPTFKFYKAGEDDKSDFYVFALQMYVPANGSIYSSGHTNNMFNTRKKFNLRNGEFKEETQPYYYVGLDTQPLERIKLYASDQLRDEVASLPKGYDIEVLINKPGTSLFLVKTKFGLTGWVKATNGFDAPPNIDGIRLAGD